MRLSKQPKEGQSYQRLKSAINDSLIAGKFRFFAKTSAKLNKFLVSHQMEKPMVPFIGHMHQPSCFERSWKKLSLFNINLKGALCIKKPLMSIL